MQTCSQCQTGMLPFLSSAAHARACISTDECTGWGIGPSTLPIPLGREHYVIFPHPSFSRTLKTNGLQTYTNCGIKLGASTDMTFLVASKFLQSPPPLSFVLMLLGMSSMLSDTYQSQSSYLLLSLVMLGSTGLVHLWSMALSIWLIYGGPIGISTRSWSWSWSSLFCSCHIHKLISSDGSTYHFSENEYSKYIIAKAVMYSSTEYNSSYFKCKISSELNNIHSTGD